MIPFDPIAALALRDVGLADVARLSGGRLAGDDIPISHLRRLSARHVPPGTLAYAEEGFVDRLVGGGFAAAIVAPEGLTRWGSRPAVVHHDPATAFYRTHVALVGRGAYGRFPTGRGTGGRLASSAVIHESVWIGDEVEIGDHVTVHGNVALADGARIEAGTVLGGDGFLVVDLGQGRTVIPHAGGVVLGEGAVVGSNCSIDRGLFSTVTSLGPETMVDSLTYLAHDVTIGARCTITAQVDLSGVVTVGDDVWIGPNTSCNQFISFGRGAYTGTGSVVVNDVPPFTLVRGNPARPAGHMCLCHRKLAPPDPTTRCSRCGRRYRLTGDVLSLMEG